jgi:hypothetical protein
VRFPLLSAIDARSFVISVGTSWVKTSIAVGSSAEPTNRTSGRWDPELRFICAVIARVDCAAHRAALAVLPVDAVHDLIGGAVCFDALDVLRLHLRVTMERAKF